MMTVSFVIPTIGRSQELKSLLASFTRQTVKPNEIIIVDQGDKRDVDWKTEFANLPIQIYSVDFRSLTKARNFGVSKSSGDIVGFLDDDIVLGGDYVKNILQCFTGHQQALGVQGLITNFEATHTAKVGGNGLVYRAYNLFAKIFLLNNSSRTNKLLWSGRNQYASRVDKMIGCEWLSGIGNYRRKVFEEFTFDENLVGYALGEDKLFSFPISEKYPGSLFLDPTIKCEHHHADGGRPQSRAWVEMKIDYTYYLWDKLFREKGILAVAAYWWANLGDLLVVFFSLILGKNSLSFFWWHAIGYWKILWRKTV